MGVSSWSFSSVAENGYRREINVYETKIEFMRDMTYLFLFIFFIFSSRALTFLCFVIVPLFYVTSRIGEIHM